MSPELLLPLQPATGHCELRLDLDAAGKPRACRRPGYVKAGSVNLCRGCFDVFKRRTESELRSVPRS